MQFCKKKTSNADPGPDPGTNPGTDPGTDPLIRCSRYPANL